MGIRKIVTIGDDALRKHCKPQEKFDKRLATLLKDMKCELLPGNSAEVVRQAMANCRERICGKGYDGVC